MYKPGVRIKTFAFGEVKLNIESIGVKRGAYLYHFDCEHCKHQSVEEYEPNFSCNEYAPIEDSTDRHLYCLSFER